MTNKEAAEVLKIIHTDENGVIRKPLEMAIKALEQGPSGDLINRQAVIDACEQSINILEAVDRIMDLPSVEQEPVLDKIREIVDEWKADTWTDNLSYECMLKIADLLAESEDKE